METADGNRLDGCQFGDPSPKDYRMEFGDLNPPKQVDLRAHCTDVENQGTIGSCTANACVGALEYFYRKRDGNAPELSRMFVYYNTRRLKGTIPKDTGAMINEAMASVMAFGACEEQHWPYDPGLFSQEPPQTAYANGRLHEAIQYARVPGAPGAINALANGYPVVYGTFLPQRCYEEAARTGVIPSTNQQERTSQPGGGHCMLIVGYDLDRKIFIVRNSWGTQWGNGGYCEIPFEEMIYWSPPDTFWIMLELEPKGNFSVIQPGTGEASQTAPAQAEEPKLGVTAGSLRDSISSGLRADLDRTSADIRARGDALRGALSGKPAGTGASPSGGQFAQPKCTMCQGTGDCWYCKGTGTNMGYPCGKCTVEGVCVTCGGSGKY